MVGVFVITSELNLPHLDGRGSWAGDVAQCSVILPLTFS